jgi:hypothetical protein
MSTSAADCGAHTSSLPQHISAKYSGRGWTAELKARFLDHLAGKGNVRAACARVGLSAEAAYRLRRRDALFGRAWAAALVLARESSVQVLAERAVDGIEETVWHRGEAVGTRRRYDTRLLLAHIGRLDRLVDEEAASADAGRFDELLARVAGEEIPETLRSEDGVLPLEREASIEKAVREELNHVDWEDGEEPGAYEDEDEDYLDEEELEERRIEREEEERTARIDDRLMEAEQRGRARINAAWDAWTDRTCEVVDKAAGWSDTPPAPGLPGSGVPLATTQAVKEAVQETAKLPEFFRPCTVSTVSTSALAHVLSGPRGWHHHQTAPRSPAALRKGTGRRR